MNKGIFGYTDSRLIKKESKSVVENLGLEVYTISSFDYSANTGTINLPSIGNWLLIGTCTAGAIANSISLVINSENVLALRNDNSNQVIISASFSKQINNSNSFSYSYVSGIVITSFTAIKLSGAA